MSNHLSPESEQDAFMRMFILEAYEGGIRSSFSTIEKYGFKLPPQWQAVAEWFRALPATDRQLAADLVRMVADTVAFQCCCVLDNLKLTPLGDRKITFSLVAEDYVPRNDERKNCGVPVRINDPQRLELLHDRFRSLVKIWPEENESSKQPL